nr:MAG TPA: hypothetical protein [Caudoviricetes sp.]
MYTISTPFSVYLYIDFNDKNLVPFGSTLPFCV